MNPNPFQAIKHLDITVVIYQLIQIRVAIKVEHFLGLVMTLLQTSKWASHWTNVYWTNQTNST